MEAKTCGFLEIRKMFYGFLKLLLVKYWTSWSILLNFSLSRLSLTSVDSTYNFLNLQWCEIDMDSVESVHWILTFSWVSNTLLRHWAVRWRSGRTRRRWGLAEKARSLEVCLRRDIGPFPSFFLLPGHHKLNSPLLLHVVTMMYCATKAQSNRAKQLWTETLKIMSHNELSFLEWLIKV